MPEGHLLEFAGVTKRFGGITAVSGLTARVEPGRVTGFLGPNGAGKTTSLRILLGLVRATDGAATIGGKPYAKLAHPLQTVGAVLEASSFHPGRTAADHLRVYAAAAAIPRTRVDAALGLVGLADAAGRKVGGFSLGMRQRLGLAYALLGDPGVLVLDEPANGLDPEGIRWLRGFLRQLAAEGRTVLVSSHMLAEVQQTVDAIVVISQGRMVYQGALEDLADPDEYATTVDAPDRAALTAALSAAKVPFDVLRSGATIRGFEPAEIGRIAAEAGVALSSLQRKGPALEEVFLELVSGQRIHVSATDAPAADTAVAAPSVDETAPAPATEDATPAEPERDAEQAEASVAAELESETGGAPGAAIATGAAVAAASVAEERPAERVAEPPTTTAAFAVASTGVIDIVPQDALPEDADPDVEALGAVDEELSEPAGPERPFDVYDKTDSDLEADAFFSGFDDGTGAPARDADAHEEGEQR